MMDFEVSTAVGDGGVSVISANGELDLASAEKLAESARPTISERRALAIDLSGCTFIDSSGLRLVLHLHHALAENGQAMAVAVADGHVRKLLSLTAIDQSVPVFAALSDAIAFLGARRANGATAPQWPLPAANAGTP